MSRIENLIPETKYGLSEEDEAEWRERYAQEIASGRLKGTLCNDERIWKRVHEIEAEKEREH